MESLWRNSTASLKSERFSWIKRWKKPFPGEARASIWSRELPEFFRKYGFETVAREEAPNFFECLTCPQYGKTCHPEVMKLDLQ